MRILSGVKATGRPHLGNYFGAIRQFIALQEQGEGYYFVADLHALDLVRDAEQIHAHPRLHGRRLAVLVDVVKGNAVPHAPKRCGAGVSTRRGKREREKKPARWSDTMNR